MMRIGFVPAAFACALLVVGSAAAQEAAPRPATWVYGGLGVGVIGEFGGPALVLGVAHSQGPHYFTARLTGTGGFYQVDASSDLGVLYGRAGHGRRSRYYAAAGVAVVDGTRCDGFDFLGVCSVDRVSSTVVGLPLAAGISWSPATSFGLGLQAFANVNSFQSFAGALVVLELGRLR